MDDRQASARTTWRRTPCGARDTVRRVAALCAGTSVLGGCYTVNSFVDAPDANPGDGVCARAPTEAELRSGVGASVGSIVDARSTLAAAAKMLSTDDLARVTAGELKAASGPVFFQSRESLKPLLAAQPGRAKGGLSAASPIGLCTLRAAVMEASAHPWKSVIQVPPGTYTLTRPFVDGTGGPLRPNSSMRIQGAGAATTVIDGGNRFNVFLVDRGNVDVEINHVTLRRGNSSAGGGLYALRGRVELEDVVFDANFGFTGGGAIAVGEQADVTIRRATFSGNRAQGAFGGAAWNVGRLSVHDSTFVDNQSNRAGAIHNNQVGTLNLRNVTISGNRADVLDPSGASGVGGIQQNGFAFLNNVTITGNVGTADRAGGIETIAGATTVMKNSIVAGNDGRGGPDDCHGALSFDSMHNLIGRSAGCTITGYPWTYRLDVDPGLGLLADAGGPTRTHALSALSPAVDAGYGFPPPAADACEPFDQRGVPRPQGQGPCDMGAVEFGQALVAVTGFMLVDAASDADIRELRNDDWLVLPQLPPQLSVRAITTGAVGSVVFGFAGNPAYRTENSAPYALGGDAAGDYAPVAFAAGQLRLRATPYGHADGVGAAGIGREIRFNVLTE